MQLVVVVVGAMLPLAVGDRSFELAITKGIIYFT